MMLALHAFDGHHAFAGLPRGCEEISRVELGRTMSGNSVVFTHTDCAKAAQLHPVRSHVALPACQASRFLGWPPLFRRLSFFLELTLIENAALCESSLSSRKRARTPPGPALRSRRSACPRPRPSWRRRPRPAASSGRRGAASSRPAAATDTRPTGGGPTAQPLKGEYSDCVAWMGYCHDLYVHIITYTQTRGVGICPASRASGTPRLRMQ